MDTPSNARSSASPRVQDAPANARNSSRRGGRAANSASRRRPATAAPGAGATATSTANGDNSGENGAMHGDAGVASSSSKPHRGRGKSASARGDASGRSNAAAAAAGAAGVGGDVVAAPKPPPTPIETLVHAIRYDDIAAFRAVLASHADLDVNTTFTPDGDAALVEACRYARREMAALLLSEKRADVNVASTNKKAGRLGLTPLIAACMALDAPLVESLLCASSAPLELLRMYGRINAVMACVLFSVANGYTDAQAVQGAALLETLLTHAQTTGALADVLAFQTERDNPFALTAATVANWRALAVLRTFGADLDAVNRLGVTAMQTVEENVLERRNLLRFAPPKPFVAGKKNRRQGKSKRSGGDATATADVDAAVDEPESQADRQTKAMTKRMDKAVEKYEVARTYDELARTSGYGPLFARKADSSAGFSMRCLVLKHVGFINLANAFALTADPERTVMIDRLVYTRVVMHYGLLKDGLADPSLWQSAPARASSTNTPSASKPAAATTAGDVDAAAASPAQPEPVKLTPTAFKLIMDDVLANRSLSRRVQTMAVVLLQIEAPFAADTASSQPLLRDLSLYRAIAERLYHTGTKILFCVFDRTDIEDGDCYDEEIEFHLLTALTELFLQFFVPFATSIEDRSGASAITLSATAAFQLAIAPVKKLWPFVAAGMSSIDDPTASPQRFSLLLHLLQVVEQIDASLVADEAATLATLLRIVKSFARAEAAKKRPDRTVASRVRLLQTIARALPLPAAFLAHVTPLKDKLDILIRSDAKIIGVDLYALAAVSDDFIRLEHKVDYLGALAEEQHGSVSVSISRASAASHVEFILQQVLSTSARNLKGELNVTLINEPGVGVGVIREFFQIVQKCFFSPTYTGRSDAADLGTVAVAPHTTEIGVQWLHSARAGTAARTSRGRQNQQQLMFRSMLALPGVMNRINNGNNAQARTLSTTLAPASDFMKLFPLFEFVDTRVSDELRITARPVRVARSVIDAKQRAEQLSLSASDVIVDKRETEALKKLYQCVGRLLGLAIRHHQPLNVHWSLALWQFLAYEPMSWSDYCGANDVFRRSLQFVLDHDFDAAPLEMHFEVATPVVVVDDSSSDDSSSDGVAQCAEASTAPPATSPTPPTMMELQLKAPVAGSSAPVAVTNANKLEYVELRAKHHFFGHEGEYYRKLRDGLLDTIQRSDLRLFRAAELQRLARGERTIDFASMKRAVLYASGASPAHRVVEMFWDVVEQFDQEQREQLLTFWSGSPQPPLFGFETMARSMGSDAAVWYIEVDARMKSSHCPMANTCDRRLILPNYPSADVLKTKLCVALSLGSVGYDRM